MVSVHAYKNEHSICQISPLDLADVIVHRGHFVVVFPDRFFIPKGLWKDIRLVCYSISLSGSPSSRVTIVRTFSSSLKHGMNRQDDKYGAGRTNITSVGGEKWHPVCDVNVVVVK